MAGRVKVLMVGLGAAAVAAVRGIAAAVRGIAAVGRVRIAMMERVGASSRLLRLRS